MSTEPRILYEANSYGVRCHEVPSRRCRTRGGGDETWLSSDGQTAAWAAADALPVAVDVPCAASQGGGHQPRNKLTGNCRRIYIRSDPPHGFSDATVLAAYPFMPIVLRSTHSDGAATGGRILLVDDDDDLLEAFSFLLRRAGFSPSMASSLPAAIQLFDSERPELAVLDVDLGRWSGLDLLQQRRERSSMPSLLLTGSLSEHVKARSLARTSVCT